MASMAYEALLLFGVLFISDYLFDTLTQSRHGLMLRRERMIWETLIMAIYFGWFWSQGRQTLPMKVWHLAIVEADGRALSPARAVLRFLVALATYLPGFATYTLTRDYLPIGQCLAIICIATLMVPLWARLDPQRQFLHDRLLGTRMIEAGRQKAADPSRAQ